MKFRTTFKEFVNEEDSYAIVATGKDSNSLDNQLVLDSINAALERVTKDTFITPYIGLGAVGRVLAYASIILPQHIFLDNEAGEVVFDATNMAAQLTDRNPNIDGNVTNAYYVYFEWARDDDGKYIIFAQLVSSEELEELLHTDLDGDNEEGEDPVHQAIVKGGDISEAAQNRDKFITDTVTTLPIHDASGQPIGVMPRFAVWEYSKSKGKYHVIETSNNLSAMQRKYAIGANRIIKIGQNKKLDESLVRSAKKYVKRGLRTQKQTAKKKASDHHWNANMIRSTGSDPLTSDELKDHKRSVSRSKKYRKFFQKEEPEEVNEISKAKIRDYLQKSSDDNEKRVISIRKTNQVIGDMKAIGVDPTMHTIGPHFKNIRLLLKRTKSQEKAKKRLKEEPLDEISKDKLRKYVVSSDIDIDHRIHRAKKIDQKIRDVLSVGVGPRDQTVNSHMHQVRKLVKRAVFNDKAKRKLKEEPLDEISDDKLQNYINSSDTDIARRKYIIKQSDKKLRNLAAIGVEPRIQTVAYRKTQIDKLDKRIVFNDKARDRLGEEPINELSTKKLLNYLITSTVDAEKHSSRAIMAAQLGDPRAVDFHIKKVINRRKGQDLAAHIAIERRGEVLEEPQEIDEISREKLNQYIRKSANDAVSSAIKGGKEVSKGNLDGLIKHMAKAQKRTSGIELARKKRDKKVPPELGEVAELGPDGKAAQPVNEVSKNSFRDFTNRKLKKTPKPTK